MKKEWEKKTLQNLQSIYSINSMKNYRKVFVLRRDTKEKNQSVFALVLFNFRPTGIKVIRRKGDLERF